MVIVELRPGHLLERQVHRLEDSQGDRQGRRASREEPAGDAAADAHPGGEARWPHAYDRHGEHAARRSEPDLVAEAAAEESSAERAVGGDPVGRDYEPPPPSSFGGSLKSSASVFSGLAGGRGDRVLQLRTPFGGGKTHSLVALLHLARAGAAASGVPELAGLPDPGRVRVAVLSGEELDPVRQTVTVGGMETHTLWGELGAQLGRFDLVAEHDRLRSAPGGATLRELLAGDPVLLLLDEVLTYVEKGMAVPQGESTLGRQAMLFMQALTETVNSLPGTVMVYSLQASVGEAVGSEGLLAQLDHLVSRVDAKREPVSGDEVMRVVQRRLFADLGDESVHREVARAYADLVRRQLQAGAETNDARREAEREASRLEARVLTAYPFHPALLDLMYHRWGSLPSYQRTRGALQFLACVIHDLWQRGDDSALIGPGEVSLADPPTRGAFFTQVGERERYQSVLDADVTSDGAGAAVVDRRVGTDSPSLAQLQVGTRMATAIMLYSFGSREGEDRGVLESDLVTATVVPGIDRNVIVAALHDLREEQLFLHYMGRRYRYEPTYNLTKLVRDRGPPDRPGRPGPGPPVRAGRRPGRLVLHVLRLSQADRPGSHPAGGGRGGGGREARLRRRGGGARRRGAERATRGWSGAASSRRRRRSS